MSPSPTTRDADINATDFLGKTPLLAAVAEKKSKITRFLLDQKANVNHVNPYGGTNVLWEAQSAEMVRVLLDYRVDVNHRCQTHKGNAVLDLVQRQCAIVSDAGAVQDMVKLLVDVRGDVLVQDGQGLTPLLAATTNDTNKNLVEFLLQRGATVEVGGDVGEGRK